MEEEEEDRQCIRRGQTAGKRAVDLFFWGGGGRQYKNRGKVYLIIGGDRCALDR